MISDLHFSPDSIAVVRNGIDQRHWHYRPDMVGEKKVIALVGRLSGPKGELARRIITDVFPSVIRRIPNIECWIVGGMKESEEIPRLIHTVNAAIGSEKILFRGFIKDIDEVYRYSVLIIGSGRVAMEALACGTRVIAVGESSSPGLYSAEIEQQALETNFGDAGKPEPIDYSKIENDIVTVLTQDTRSTAEQGRAVIEREYALDRIAQRISRVYVEAIAAKMGIHEIPVLMYHRVTGTKPAGTKHGIYVTTAEFEQQLVFLERKGYKALTFADLSEILRGDRKLQARPIMLTFDDGYEDNFVNAFPILKRHSMKAVVFILGDRSISTNVWDIPEGEPEAKLLNDEQIQVMAEYGIELGSHSMDHRRLTELSVEEAQNEITASKLLLEKRLGRGVISLAYPYGAVNERVKECVSYAGYEFGIAVDSGPRNFFDDLYEIRRIQIFPGAGFFSFWKKTSGKYHRYKRIKK
jgi:peptidoglycan/xylan/chitin deacetylase (PgdA/CDA1 family)